MARLSTARIDKATPRSPQAALTLVRRKTASEFVTELVVAISTIGAGSACPTAMTVAGVTESCRPEGYRVNLRQDRGACCQQSCQSEYQPNNCVQQRTDDEAPIFRI